MYASSSSVYDRNKKLLSSIDGPVKRPVSVYGATKRADELLTYSYCHTRGLSATGLRFFTVYGPWGRPDMAAYLFADTIVAGRPIKVFGHGRMRRDFTFVADITAGVISALDCPPQQDKMGVRHAVYSLGNNRSERLMDFIGILAKELGREPTCEMPPMQTGDVEATFADVDASERDLGFRPSVSIADGIPFFARWYKSYHSITSPSPP